MSTTVPLSHAQAKRVYDRIGRGQDTQAFYEDRFTRELVRHSELDRAVSVLELGCGTGRFAARLLDEELTAEARYVALDQSDTMIELTRARLARFGERVSVRRTDGSVRLEADDGTVDRVMSTYVLDLLSDDDIATFVDEAHRVLAADGRLCLTSATEGEGGLDRLVTGLVKRVWSWNPSLIGGCRPIPLRPFLSPDRWELVHHATGSAFGIASEVIVARPL